jgi:hypothetical protein
MQSGTFLGAVVGPSGFGLLAEYVSFTMAWSVAGVAAVMSAVLLALGVRSLERKEQKRENNATRPKTAA